MANVGNQKNKNWIPYNDEALREGEVLVPQLVDDRKYAIALGAKPENLRTWLRGGIPYTVMFVPVPADQEKVCWQAFNAAVNELLDEKIGPNRYSRCLVPQPDGTMKVCPKVKNGNHEPCATCPYKDKYEREDNNLVSLGELNEEDLQKIEFAPSAEAEGLMKLMFNDLKEYLHKINPSLEDAVTLGFQGFDKSEIVKRLPVKSSQAYDLYAKAERLTREFLRR